MNDETKSTVNDGGELTQQAEPQQNQGGLGLDSIRNAESYHRERSMSAVDANADKPESTESADAGTEPRMFGYKANKQETEIELEHGLSVEPGSPGEMQLKNILGGYGAFKAAQEGGGNAGLADAIKEQTEALRQTIQPKEETTPFNPMEYVVPDEMPIVENAISAFEEIGLDRGKAEEIVNGIYGAIGRTRAYQSASTEETKQSQETNAFIQQLSRLHNLDPELPNPLIDPNETATHLQNDDGFVNWLRGDMNIQTNFLDPSIVKLYGLYMNREQKATNKTLSNANLDTKKVAEPSKTPPRNIDNLKTVSTALEGAGGAPVGMELSPQELAEFNNLPSKQKKLVMNRDYRYWNYYVGPHSPDRVNSNTELEAFKHGAR